MAVQTSHFTPVFSSGSKKWTTRKVVLLLLLELLVLSVRLVTSPIPSYVSVGDEGIYMSIMYYNAYGGQSEGGIYRGFGGVNFGNINDSHFDPGVVFNFYDSFIYPEILIGDLFGVSATNAIAFVLLMSLVEALFAFLIIDHIAGTRSATLGMILLAFFPLDVVYSNYVQPFVPLAAFTAITLFFFVKSLDDKKGLAKYALAAGIFANIAYEANPWGLLDIMFIVAYLAATYVWSSAKGKRSVNLRVLAFSALGFLLTFSITGVYYFALSGNFFLYPAVDHNVFARQVYLTWNQGSTLIGLPQPFGSYVVDYVFSAPNFYVQTLLGGLTGDGFQVYLLSVMLYLAIFGSIMALLKRVRKEIKHALLFAAFFVVLLFALNFLPTAMVPVPGGLTVIGMADHMYVYLEILALPIVIVSAVAIGWLFDRGGICRGIALAMIITALFGDFLSLSYDSAYYKAGLYSYIAFAGFYNQHKNATFYVNDQFGGNARFTVGGRAGNIVFVSTCQPVSTFADGSYLVEGGTISISASPSLMQRMEDCYANFTRNITPVYYEPNPFAAYASPEPPLEIYRIGNGTR